MKVFTATIFMGYKKIPNSGNEFLVEIDRELTATELMKIGSSGMLKAWDALTDLENNNPNFHRIDGGKTEDGLISAGFCIAESRQHAQRQCEELAKEVIRNNWHK